MIYSFVIDYINGYNIFYIFFIYVNGTMPLVVGYVYENIYCFLIIFLDIVCVVCCW
jgi:uncharacterized membrane protein